MLFIYFVRAGQSERNIYFPHSYSMPREELQKALYFMLFPYIYIIKQEEEDSQYFIPSLLLLNI